MISADNGQTRQKGCVARSLSPQFSPLTDCVQGGRGGFGRGGSRASNHWRERTNKADLDRHNDRYETYYNELGIVGEDEKDKLWETMRRDLPNSFRFTGSKAY